MQALTNRIETWVDRARAKLKDRTLSGADLDELLTTITPTRAKTRQRLLYLQAQYATIHSSVLSFALHEPGKPATDNGITGETVEWPYSTVYDAIMDGWQVVSFPQQRATRSDGQVDLMGFEFILQKLETYDA